MGENTKRALFTGVKYVLPEPQDKVLPSDRGAMEKLFENFPGDGAGFIAGNIKGVAYQTAAEIISEFGERPAFWQVSDYLCGEDMQPCVVLNGGEPIDFRVKSNMPEKIIYPTLLEAQKAYYDYVYGKKSFSDAGNRLNNALGAAKKKLEKRLQNIREKLLESKDAEAVKLKGELLTANLYAVPQGAESFEAVNYYDEAGGKIKIALDCSLSPAQNAQKYFKRYAKLKRTQENAREQLGQAETRMDYLESIAAHISAAESLYDLEAVEAELKKEGILKDAPENGKKQKKPSLFRAFSVDGFKILAGRNNLQNDRLLKSVRGGDMWLHTQDRHSAHVVIVCGGKEPPAHVLLAAAEICAYYSEGRNGTKIPVDYTYRKFVKKPPASAPGFVIYTDFKTLLAEPDSHAKEGIESDE